MGVGREKSKQQDPKKQESLGKSKRQEMKFLRMVQIFGTKMSQHTAGRGKPTASPWLLKTSNHLPGLEYFNTVLQNCATAHKTHGLMGIPGPAYLTHQFSARSSRIALVTHRFRWDRRPKIFSYLQNILGISTEPWDEPGCHPNLRMT